MAHARIVTIACLSTSCWTSAFTTHVTFGFRPPQRSTKLQVQVLNEATAAKLCEERFVIVNDIISPSLTDGLRRDAFMLRESGHFVESKIGSRNVDEHGDLRSSASASVETRVSETGWLRPRPAPGIGDLKAREALDRFVEQLRIDLIAASGIPLLPFVRRLGVDVRE